MKRVLRSFVAFGLLTSGLSFACSNPEIEAVAQLWENMLVTETTIKNLKVGHRVKDQDGKPAFTVAATFETIKIGGSKNKQSAVYIVNIKSDCSIESEQLVYVDKY